MNPFLDELSAYVGFTDDDRARLRALHPVLQPQFPEIAGKFYDAIWKNPGAAAVLTGPEQVDRLRVTLIDWMSSGLIGPYDDRFYDNRSRPGMPPEVQRRVYEPFFSTKEGGTGLGMSIVHSLVALHGGAIAFETGPRGTRFDVTIPRHA